MIAMKDHIVRHLITEDATVREALAQLDELAVDAVLFLHNDDCHITGSLTDGDVRRYLLNGGSVNNEVAAAAFRDMKFIRVGKQDVGSIRTFRKAGLQVVPVLNDDGLVVDILNFRTQRSYLPLDAVIMAGGMGTRLRPLTENIPKPLLSVGGKPIVEHNIDRLRAFGIINLTISINYLGEQIVEYFGDGAAKNMNINYVTEDEPRGTIGAISDVPGFKNDYVLVMNSDLLTTIDIEEMFLQAISKDADMLVGTVPYEVKVPYGVIETQGDLVKRVVEKPTYTYYSNAGVYIIRREHVAKVPAKGRFGAPDLMELLYASGHRVVHFPIMGYWLDIGKHHDYEKAQQDIKYLDL